MYGEIERMMSNLLRVGVISELDEANARVKMKVGGLSTDWLPWGVARAGATRTWSAPRVGDQHVLFSPYGDPAQGIVGPAVYQESQPAPAASKDQEHILLPDGSTVDYNSATNTLTISVSGNGNVVINCKHATVNATEDVTANTKTATVNASTKVELATPTTHCTGALTVDGPITGLGGMSISGTTGGAAASITGPVNINGNTTTSGSLTNNGKAVGSTLRVSGVQAGGSNSGTPI